MPDSGLHPIIISRQEAKSRGLKRFFTGATCARGHASERFVSNGNCYECNKQFASTHPELGRKRSLRSYYKSHEKNKAIGRLTKRKEWATNNGKRRNRNKEWYANNKALSQAKNKAWRDAHPGYCVQKVNEWRKKNPERFRINAISWTQGRKARKRQNGGSFTADDIARILKLQKGKCAICSEKLDGHFHIDHVVPLARGGANDRRNLQLAHPKCNNKKRDKDPIDHMRSLGYLL